MNKTTLKARCGTEIRKNWIHHNNDMSMNDLVAKMQRYFSIGDPAAIKLKYRDEEKDWVTLTDDDELAYALTTMREQLYVDVIGAENAVGEIAAVHSEVKTEPEEAAKMAQKWSPSNVHPGSGPRDTPFAYSWPLLCQPDLETCIAHPRDNRETALANALTVLREWIPPAMHKESKELAKVAQKVSAPRPFSSSAEGNLLRGDGPRDALFTALCPACLSKPNMCTSDNQQHVGAMAALTTMLEQNVEVIGADNAVGETAAVRTEVKTGPKEAAKIAQTELPAIPFPSIGELTEIPLSLLGIPPAMPTESWEEYEQPPQVDLVQLLHRVCDDPATVQAVADELIANPPTEDDPLLCVQFLPQMWNQPNAPPNPIQTIVAALSNNINGGVNLNNAGMAFSFATWERLFACRIMLATPGGPGNQSWAFYAGPLMVAGQVGAIAPVGYQPTAVTFLVTAFTNTAAGHRATVCPFDFFKSI